MLLAAGSLAEAEALRQAIAAAGPEVRAVDAARFPPTLGELASFDLVVLSDLNARLLSRSQMEALRSYVRDLGGGLLMAGARESFGLGGYAHTPVEEALPARFDLRQRKDRLSLAMVIAIDKSGSMGMAAGPGATKLDLANEAAARSALLLAPLDRVGVMHVDTEVGWTQPMVSVRDPQAIAAAVRGAEPGGGGIFVDVTMEASYAALEEEETQLRHFLLFSDGSDSENLGGTEAQVRRAASAGITTSVVSMGVGPDTPALERFAQLGGGRFYIVDDLRELPRIFTQETIEASRAALVEEPFRAVPTAPSAILAGLDLEAAPALRGYALLNARGRATTLLRAGEEDPLLAVWQFGVGRSAVFATDVGAELGRPWLAWPGYATLFGQLARALARAPERRDARLGVRIEGGVGRVTVEAVSEGGGYRNYLELGGMVAGPGGEGRPLELVQTAPGRYEASFPADAPGPYLVTVREGDEAEAALVGSAGVVRPAGSELRGAGTDRTTLERLAALTGGSERTDLAEVFRDRPPPTWAFAPLWPG
ncbi:MAG: VWA domain-containing protein, partial [Myxococcota bacterium]